MRIGLMGIWPVRTSIASLACLSAATITLSPATAATLPPKDDCLRIDGYFALRQELEDIVKTRDATRLVALATDAIASGFDDEDTKSAFDKGWKLSASGADSPIWVEFDRMLPLGCGTVDGEVALPYLYTVELPENFQEADGVIIGTSVNLRQAPSTASASLAKLDWEVVRELEWTTAWTKVQTDKGITGFVSSSHFRSQIDFRAGFKQINGRWKMTYFIAGD